MSTGFGLNPQPFKSYSLQYLSAKFEEFRGKKILVTLKEKVSDLGCKASLSHMGVKKKKNIQKIERTFRPESLRAHESNQLVVHRSAKST